MARHREVRLMAAQLLCQGGASCDLDRSVGDSSSERSADLWIPASDGKRQLCVDFVVTHTWSSSASGKRSVGRHMVDLEARKKEDYMQLC